MLIIGIDGLRYDAVDDAHMPFLSGLRERDDARWQRLDASDGQRQKTYSAPSWVSLLTARPAAEHHIRSNDSAGPVASETVFESLQRTGDDRRSLFVTDWPPLFELLAERLGSLPAQQLSAAVVADDAAVEQWINQQWNACQPDLAFVHLNAVDDAGHASAFDPASTDYAVALLATDARLSRILGAVGVGAQAEQMVVVVSDHGGIGNHHGGFQPDERIVPLLMLMPPTQPKHLMRSLADVGDLALRFIDGKE